MLTSLKKHFNFSSFRPGQEEIIQSIQDGKDVVALMPTGGGKSLCYQLPAVIDKKITVIISPLIALMKDQVDSLNARGISAAFINSSLSFEEIQSRIIQVKNGQIKLLYVAPERFASQQFRQLFSDLNIGLLAVDEAHCVSQWGHDFRPDYLHIKDYIRELKNRPTVAAFTATATPEVKDDIIKNLELQNPQVFIRGFDRPNLQFFAQNSLKPKQRKKEVLRIIKTLPGSGIVYTISRKETEEMAGYLSQNGITAVAYHAGMGKEERKKAQEDFMENKFKVIVATIAFGMGVDKADIRFVIHAGMPNSLEGYYQEAGRAGRDGEKAFCILLHSKKDNGLHNYFILQSKKEMSAQGKSFEEIQRICNVKYRHLDSMISYVEHTGCRRKNILAYFADPDIDKQKKNCGGCDACLDFKWENATPGNKKRSNQRRSPDILTSDSDDSLPDTVMETIKLYKQNYSPEDIAKIRSLGVSTIFTHLIRWYLDGGDLDFEKFITPEEERQILLAMSKAEDYTRLNPIKEHLGDSISYEQIKLVIAKIQGMKII